MAQQITLRRGTATEWSAVGGSLVLAAGEPGFETDTGKLKIGDGTSVWNSLSYVSPSDLADLANVSSTTPSLNQVLTWTGLQWEPISPVTNLSDLNDVSGTIPSINQVLTWSGTEWIPDDLPADSDTTYSISAETAGSPGSANLRLTDSNTIVDEVTFVGSGTVSVSRTDANNITINGASFDTNSPAFTGTTNVDTLNAITKITVENLESTNPLKITAPQFQVKASSGTIFGSGSEGINGAISQVFSAYTPFGFTFTQSHEVQDCINFHFLRSRGTTTSPTGVLSQDKIGQISFWAHSGSDYASGAVIEVTADGAPTPDGLFPTPGKVPSRFDFYTNNGTTTASRARLTKDGVWTVDSITALTTNGNLALSGNGTGVVTLPAGSTVGGVPIGSITITGSVANQASLPTQPVASGTAYVVLSPAPSHLWVSDGAAWVDLGEFQGPAGADGANGADGADGVGVPVGGAAGEVLAKIDGVDYNTQWLSLSTVASSGSYNDLIDTPIIPSVLTDLGITDGTVGQVLTTDGFGNFTFDNVSTVAALDDLTDVVISGTPTTGQVLKYDGTNWVNGTDNSSTVFTRQTLSGTTSSLANGATGPINITGYKSYALLKIQTSAAAWVRIYADEASRIADASRAEGTDPLPGAGIIAEVITTGAETILITPGTIGFNNESPVTDNIPIRVTNKSGGTAAITVTLTAIQLEA